MNKPGIFVFAAIVLTAAACGGDDAQKGTNNDTENNLATIDMGSETDDSGSTPSDMGAEPVDMGTTMADMAGEADMGGETDMGGEADMGPPPYDWPATGGDFITSADRVSYIWSFGVPAVNGGVAECCEDFGAISATPGQIDNSFAVLNDTLSGFGVGIDFQAALDDAIGNGDLAFLLDHRELDGSDDADGFLLSWLDGGFAAGTTWASASTGTGVFDVRASSFVSGTGEPARVMNRADMTGSVMSGGPISIDVILPFGAAAIYVPVQSMNATASANVTVDSVTYSQGELSGYILEDDVFDGLNDLASSPACTCLGLNGGELYSKTNGRWAGNCDSGAPAKCPNSSEYACRVIAGTSLQDGGVCTLLPGIVQNSADIELSGDDDYDALSIGLTWDAVGASLQ